MDSTGPHWTWRGTPGLKSPEAGRYYKKGMRIDYSLISHTLLDRLVCSDIVGEKHERHKFYGSDHSPILLKLKHASQCTNNDDAKGRQ